MSNIRLDTDYLRELANEFGTAVEVVEEAVRTLKTANGSFFLGLTSEGKTINAKLAEEVTYLTKLKGGLGEIKNALINESNELETYINTTEPKLSQLTDEIKIANGYTPPKSSNSSGNGNGSAQLSSESETIPVTPVPPTPDNDPTPNINIPENIQEVISKVIGFFKNIFSFWG